MLCQCIKVTRVCAHACVRGRLVVMPFWHICMYDPHGIQNPSMSKQRRRMKKKYGQWKLFNEKGVIEKYGLH